MILKHHETLVSGARGDECLELIKVKKNSDNTTGVIFKKMNIH